MIQEQINNIADMFATGNYLDIAIYILAAIFGIFALFGIGIELVNLTGQFISFISSFAVVLLVIAIVVAVLSIIKYVVKSLALFFMARRKHHKFAWYAFIPYFRIYLMYTISDKPAKEMKKRNVEGIIMSIYEAVLLIPMPIYIKIPLRIVAHIMHIMRDYRLFAEFNNKIAVVFTILSFISDWFRMIGLWIAFWTSKKDELPIAEAVK